MTVIYTVRITQIVDDNGLKSESIKAWAKNKDSSFMQEWRRRIEKNIREVVNCDGATCDNIQVFLTDENKMEWS